VADLQGDNMDLVVSMPLLPTVVNIVFDEAKLEVTDMKKRLDVCTNSLELFKKQV
jgi:hypothetical protein